MRCPYCQADVKQDPDHRPWSLWCECGAFAIGLKRYKSSTPDWCKPPKHLKPPKPHPQYKMVPVTCPQCGQHDEGIEWSEGIVDFGCGTCGWRGEVKLGPPFTLYFTAGAVDRWRPSAFEEMEELR